MEANGGYTTDEYEFHRVGNRISQCAKRLLTEDSTSKPVERSITQLAPGVTFKDGLLWRS